MEQLALQELEMTFGAMCLKIRYPYHFLGLASLAFLRAEFLYDIEISHL